MPAISKIRFTNIIYENGGKRYNDETFMFDGHNTAILLENGGGKTVFIQTALQAIIPHIDMAERKIKNTLSLENGPAHIAIEWILEERPRRYALTCVSLFMENNQLNSLKYVYDYGPSDEHSIDELPFAKEEKDGSVRGASRGEIGDYYMRMAKSMAGAHVFKSISDYGAYLENHYKIISSEWRKVATINSGEGNVDEFFNRCRTTGQLLDHLLIPVVEEGIEGDHHENFVETFQKQRDHFKKNRLLMEKIQESQWIHAKCTQYVEAFKNYEEERCGYQAELETLKSLGYYIENQIKSKQDEQALLTKENEVLEESFKDANHLKVSYELAIMAENLHNNKEALLLKEESYKHKLAQLEQLEAQKQNIQISQLITEINGLEEKLELVNQSIANGEASLSISDMKMQLAENSGQIKGVFTYDLEIIDREIGSNNQTLMDLSTKEAKLRDTWQQEETYLEELSVSHHTLSAKASLYQEDMDRIMESLVQEDQAYISLAVRSENYEHHLKKLSKESFELEEQKQALTNYIETKSKALKVLLDQQRKLNIREQVTLNQLDSYEKAASDLVNAYEACLNIHIDPNDLHIKANSIEHSIDDQLNRISNSLKSIRNQEHNLLIHKDLYENKTYLRVDAYVDEFIRILEEKHIKAIHGSKYMQSILKENKKSADELYHVYPHWMYALIIEDERERDAVYALMENQENQLNHVLHILTHNELDQLEMLPFVGKYFIPGHFNSHSDPIAFEVFAKSIDQQLEQLRVQIVEQEETFRTYLHMHQQVITFFDTYSSEYVQDIKLALKDIKTEDQQLSIDISSLELAISEDQDSINKVTMRISQLPERRVELIKWMSETQKAQDIEENLNSIDAQLRDILKQIALVSKEHDLLKEKMEFLLTEQEQFVQDNQRLYREKQRILDLELYKEVREWEPIGSTYQLSTLKAQRDELQKSLRGITSSLSTLEERKEHYDTQLKKTLRQKELLLKEAQYPFEMLTLTSDDTLDTVIDNIRPVKESLSTASHSLEEAKRHITEVETRYLVAKERIISDYGYLKKVEETGRAYEERMKIERLTIRDRIRRQASKIQEIAHKISLYEKMAYNLSLKDAVHQFTSDRVGLVQMKDDFYQEFNANSEDFLNRLLRNLEQQYSKYKSLYKDVRQLAVDIEKESREVVLDQRLIENVVNGLLKKESYDDVRHYYEKLQETIDKIIRLAEEDRKESDLELETFLTHLLSYVKNVSDELRAIESKTTVTLNDITEQIFEFDIPQWEENEAKLLIRRYIDQTIEFYEDWSLNKGMDENQLRKELEDMLHVKNLLNIVLKEQPIKVKCKKVSGDMSISKRPWSWESSNRWSGGEKWSKNMTLFLSILNYLAQKKQHLDVNQKRQRTVILDNPFGKASSDHVLKPVFKIAENLGFQIIALTAHAEGKFITEYFPVVYSLRLRETNAIGKKVMEGDKHINMAYLRENAPMTMTRMQEVSQMSLFD